IYNDASFGSLYVNQGLTRKTESSGKTVFGHFNGNSPSKVVVDSGQLTLQGGSISTGAPLEGTAFEVTEDDALLQISGVFDIGPDEITFSTTSGSRIDIKAADLELDANSTITLLQGSLHFAGDVIRTKPASETAGSIILSPGTKFYWDSGDIERGRLHN